MKLSGKMPGNQKKWVQSRPNPNPSEAEKQSIQNQVQPLVEQFKHQYIKKNPNKRFNYLVDILCQWKGSSFYLCEKFKSEEPHRITDEFDVKFVRMRYQGKDKLELAYMRHTGAWFVIAPELSLKDCLEMIRDNPVFHPVG